MHIDELKQYLNLEKTKQEFGEPKNNKSIVYVICEDCQLDRQITIQSLKNKLRLDRGTRCNACGTRFSWTNPERKIRQQRVWKDPEYRKKQSKIRKKQWENPEYQRKQATKTEARKNDSSYQERMSRQSKKQWERPEYRENQIEIQKQLWKTEEYRKNQKAFKTEEFKRGQSVKQQQVWQDPEYRENQSVKQQQVWKRPGYRKHQSAIQSRIWNNLGYQERQSKLQKQVWQNFEYRKHFEEIWGSEEYREKLSKSLTEKWKNPEFRKRASEAAKERWKDPELREKLSIAIKKMWERSEYREKQSRAQKRKWEDPEYLEKMVQARSSQLGRRSSIEKITEQILGLIGVNYEIEVPIGKYRFDFYVPEHDLFIECQGEYWHSIEGRPARDAAKFTYFEKAQPDSQILYLHEREFLNPDLIRRKLLLSMFGDGFNFIQKEFKFSDLAIRKFERKSKEPRLFLNSFHYAQFGRSAKVVYGAYLEDELVAVCKFTTPVRKEVATSMDYAYSEVLELDRFCIHPEYQKKNLASWFISRCSKLIFQEYQIKCLVSFADSTYGHFGTIYKAANWEEIGKIRPDYHYVNDDGFILHKKTLYNHAVKMGKKEKEYAEEFGYRKVFGKEKIKFVKKIQL